MKADGKGRSEIYFSDTQYENTSSPCVYPARYWGPQLAFICLWMEPYSNNLWHRGCGSNRLHPYRTLRDFRGRGAQQKLQDVPLAVVGADVFRGVGALGLEPRTGRV